MKIERTIMGSYVVTGVEGKEQLYEGVLKEIRRLFDEDDEFNWKNEINLIDSAIQYELP